MDVARIDAASVSAEDIGYKLGPRLNAAAASRTRSSRWNC